MLYAGDLGAAPEIFAGAPLNTDDWPHIEFTAPRLTRINAAGDKDWFTGESLAAFYDEVAARTASRADSFLPASADVADARRAGIALYRYALASTRHDDGEAARLEAQVRELVPEVVADGESSDPVASLADARRELAGLRTEEEQMRRRVEEMERRLDELRAEDRSRP
jgi:hypothetical protein